MVCRLGRRMQRYRTEIRHPARPLSVDALGHEPNIDGYRLLPVGNWIATALEESGGPLMGAARS